MNQTISTEESNPLAQRFMKSQEAQKKQDTNTEPSTNGLKIPDSKYEEIIKKSLVTKGNNYLIKQVLAKMRAGDEVVQLYVGCENSAVDRPLRQLKGFARVHLEAGESKPVEIRVPLEKLKWYDPAHREWKLEHTEYTVYTGSSEALKDLQCAKITLGE